MTVCLLHKSKMLSEQEMEQTEQILTQILCKTLQNITNYFLFRYFIQFLNNNFFYGFFFSYKMCCFINVQ